MYVPNYFSYYTLNFYLTDRVHIIAQVRIVNFLPWAGSVEVFFHISVTITINIRRTATSLSRIQLILEFPVGYKKRIPV